MLYQVYEMQRASLAPMRMLATQALSFLDLPFNPIRPTPVGHLAVAALDSFEHSTRAFGKPLFRHTSTPIDGVAVDIIEEIVWKRTWGQIRRFRRLADRPNDPKLLIVAPMSGHFATLLRNTVKAFLPDHDVYITDWTDAREVPVMAENFDLQDYVDYVMEMIRVLGPDVHLLAVCQPAVAVLAATALINESETEASPRSMTLIGGPIDTREGRTAVNIFAEQHDLDWFRGNVIHHVPFGYAGFMRAVYPGFLQLAGFMAMNLDRHIDAHWRMFEHLVQGDEEPLAAKRAFYDEYRSVMDLSAEFYLQTIEDIFLKHKLPRGLLTHRGHRIDLAAIERTAMLTIEGERDDISGIGQTRAAHKMTTSLPESMRDHMEQPGVGHYGLFNGKRFNAEVAPRIKRFIRAHL